jgi:hypothetical protein
LLLDIARRIQETLDAIAEAKETLNAPQPPALTELLRHYYKQRNAGAWSNKAKLGNLKEFSQLVLLLQQKGIVTLTDFEDYMRKHQDKSSAMTAALRDKSARMKELSELIRFAGEFKRLKPVYEEWNSIKFQKTREKFKTEHESELRLFLLSKRKLDAAAPDHKIPLKVWQQELDELAAAYAAESEQLKPIRDELKELYRIKSKLEPYIRDEMKKETENEKER